jgi:hypothetical protein
MSCRYLPGTEGYGGMSSLVHWAIGLFVAWCLLYGVFASPKGKKRDRERRFWVDQERRRNNDAAEAARIAQQNRHNHHR